MKEESERKLFEWTAEDTENWKDEVKFEYRFHDYQISDEMVENLMNSHLYLYGIARYFSKKLDAKDIDLPFLVPSVFNYPEIKVIVMPLDSLTDEFIQNTALIPEHVEFKFAMRVRYRGMREEILEREYDLNADMLSKFTQLKRIGSFVGLTIEDLTPGVPYWNFDGLYNRVFDSAISKLLNLHHVSLDLSGYGEFSSKKNFPSIINADKLRSLHLRGLMDISDGIGNLKQLELLRIERARSIHISPSIGKLENLKTLEILDASSIYAKPNSIDGIPDSIAKLEKLVKLILPINGDKIPKPIFSLKKLEYLAIKGDFNRSRLKYIPESIGNLKNLKSLHISNTIIDTFPESIWKLENLENLTIQSKKLTSIPKLIGNLKNLQSLSIHAHKMDTIPESIFSLKKLKYLCIGSLKIEKISEKIGDLINLEDLHITVSKSGTIPKAIFNMISLKSLSIRGSSMDTLPSSICNLKNLKYLLVQRKLQLIPDCIYKLENLEEVHLNIKYSAAPPFLAKLYHRNRLEEELTSLRQIDDAQILWKERGREIEEEFVEEFEETDYDEEVHTERFSRYSYSMQRLEESKIKTKRKIELLEDKLKQLD